MIRAWIARCKHLPRKQPPKDPSASPPTIRDSTHLSRNVTTPREGRISASRRTPKGLPSFHLKWLHTRCPSHLWGQPSMRQKAACSRPYLRQTAIAQFLESL